MTQQQVIQKLNRIFQDVFEDPGLIISSATTAKDIADWDSLAQITLISAIEDTFDIQFRMDEIRTLKNVGDMVGLILEKQA